MHRMHPFDICAVDLFCFSVLFVVSWGVDCFIDNPMETHRESLLAERVLFDGT